MTRPFWRERLPALARSLSALYFGAPVYLVGGAVEQDDPRDIDLVAVVPDQLFLAAYGDREAWGSPDSIAASVAGWVDEVDGRPRAEPSRVWRRWAMDCAKHNARLTLALHRRVDFKAQPESYAVSRAGPRQQLARVGPAPAA